MAENGKKRKAKEEAKEEKEVKEEVKEEGGDRQSHLIFLENGDADFFIAHGQGFYGVHRQVASLHFRPIREFPDSRQIELPKDIGTEAEVKLFLEHMYKRKPTTFQNIRSLIHIGHWGGSPVTEECESWLLQQIDSKRKIDALPEGFSLGDLLILADTNHLDALRTECLRLIPERSISQAVMAQLSNASKAALFPAFVGVCQRQEHKILQQERIIRTWTNYVFTPGRRIVRFPYGEWTIQAVRGDIVYMQNAAGNQRSDNVSYFHTADGVSFPVAQT